MMRAAIFATAMAITSPAIAGPSAPAPAGANIPAGPLETGNLDLGKQIALRVLPEGGFQKIMSGMADGMMKQMMDGLTKMPLSNLARITNQDPTKIASLGQATMHDLIQVSDPAFRERYDIVGRVIFAGMSRIMTQWEPSFREGLAEAYARRFNQSQLRELIAFLNSPTGAKFAEESLTMQNDPAVAGRMAHLMPAMMEAMPALMKEVQAATAHLPAPKAPDTLTTADKAKIAKLMGIDPKDVK